MILRYIADAGRISSHSIIFSPQTWNKPYDINGPGEWIPKGYNISSELFNLGLGNEFNIAD